MRSAYLLLLGIPLFLIVAPLQSAAPPAKPKVIRLSLKSGYSAGRGLLDRKFCSVQLVVEILADGSGKGRV